MVFARDLKGDLALVTGASGGIGRATCLSLAALGCNIAAHYNTGADEAAALVAELYRAGVQARAFQADLGDLEQVRALHASVVRELGHPTILFNNAGTNGGLSGVTSISEVPASAFEATWRANTLAPYVLAQQCLPAMEAGGRGRVVFCSSVAAFTGGIVGPHYASSKAALHGLVHWLSGACCAKGITVNGVAPALVAGTKMLPGRNDELARKIPVGRLGCVDEIAETVVWMVRNAYLTNKVVGVDGGMFVQ